MKKILIAPIFILIFLPLAAEKYFDVGLKGMIPVNPVLIFSSPGIGMEVDFLMLEPFVFGLEYYYTGQQFYYYDHNTDTWSPPAGWWQEAADSDQGDWIFSQFRHVMLLNAALTLGEGDLTWRVGLGGALVFFVPSDAWTYYPEFQQSFSDFAASQNVSVGFNIKGAFNYKLIPGLELMAEANYLVDQPMRIFPNVQKGGIEYLVNMAHFTFGIRYVFEDSGDDEDTVEPWDEDADGTDTYFDEDTETDGVYDEFTDGEEYINE
jgi:hypothetical protein